MPGSVDRKGIFGIRARREEQAKQEVRRTEAGEVMREALDRLNTDQPENDVQINCANNAAISLAEQANKGKWYKPGSQMAKTVDQLIKKGRQTLQ